MPRDPEISHQTIVDYILAGHTTREAKDYFSFSNDNVANIRVSTAFKRLGIKRPRYQKLRTCEFCQNKFIARDYKQKTCGSTECQRALIREWHGSNPEKARKAHAKYRLTQKGRQNNIRMHRTRRQRGLNGTTSEQWNFAVAESKKALRKLAYLHGRHPWEYRTTHIQKMSKGVREFTPRRRRNLLLMARVGVHANATIYWHSVLRALQTTLIQYSQRIGGALWERKVNQIARSLKTGERFRTWKRNQK